MFKATEVVGLEFDPDAHLYRWQGSILPSVTQVIQAAGLVDTRFFTDEGRDRGSEVHRITQLYDEHDLGDFDQDLVGYLEAWISARDTMKMHPIHVELPVVSRKYKVAGTLDRVMLSPLYKRPILADIKTGPLDDTIGLQTAGYGLCYRESFSAASPVERASVHLEADGKFRMEFYDDPLDESVFLCALTVTQWRARYRKEYPWTK